ncbi:GerMN domain-containing protein [Serpentinicella sp. ANB-PHB4]|uniref:GerMN domain-containing protein n=1 Tax=Serpentinicella sp. ANB-PHB4 TaxID=3074076 RepID=UPI0028578A51|nr:GerMN domain-containing protein [Serpentinicella sp. ANB-PHB4]MDR5659282.1 GerMN domain-containing protein [Serpentinicella sp. ANB-PHB4]
MLKKLGLCLLIFTMMISIIACEVGNPKPYPEEPNHDHTPEENQLSSVSLHYVKKSYLQSGDLSQGITTPVEKEINLDNRPIEEVILTELQKQPEDNTLVTVIDNFTFLGVTIKDNTAHVDIDSTNLHGGSLEETSGITQIVLSLIELNHIDKVQFLVNGNKQASLMGHFDTSKPLSKENIMLDQSKTIDTTTEMSQPSEPKQPTQPKQPTKPASTTEQKQNVTLYYINEKYVSTGDESLEKTVSVKKALNPGTKSIELALLNELRKHPSNGITTMSNLEILNANASNKIANVNISSKNLEGASLDERLIITQIVYTLTELSNVNSVQILVDGNKRETLMGHINIQNPLTRKDLTVTATENPIELFDINMYYMNKEYLETGNEKLPKMSTIRRTYSRGAYSIEAVILADLKKQPWNNSLVTTLEDIEIIDVETTNKLATVNIANKNLTGSSLQESAVIAQIILTLTQLPEVDQVQILVDGSKQETLMGHIEISNPLSPNTIH